MLVLSKGEGRNRCDVSLGFYMESVVNLGTGLASQVLLTNKGWRAVQIGQGCTTP
jgi:hypothetical protein